MTVAKFDILVRYVAAGSFAVGVHYLILILLVERAAIDATLASSCGFSIGVVCNYLLQYYWTFRSSGSHAQRFPLFVAVAIAMLALNAAIFWGLHERAGVNYLLAQAVAIGVVFLFNFLINSLYTFASEEPFG
ncbi:MAG: GtrA family protein [Pseudomonadota bacterium]|nr:GtrA family protein [Pseudomonadota bacterium]